LLYESSLPWSCFAAASPSGFLPAGTYSAAAWCGFSPYRNSCCRRSAICTRCGSTGLASREIFPEACRQSLQFHRDSSVVPRSCRKHFARQFQPRRQRRVARALEFLRHALEILGISDDRHALEIFRRRTLKHRRPRRYRMSCFESQLFRGQPGFRRRRLKRVQIVTPPPNQSARCGVPLPASGLPRSSPEEEPPMHFRMQGFSRVRRAFPASP